MKALEDLPSRIFDLLPFYMERYGEKDCLFANIKNGKPVKYDCQHFCQLTNALCIGMLRLGLRKGDKIALIASNSPQWNMVDFACQQIGAVFVPIYPNISVNEFDYILEHSEAKAVFLESQKTYIRHKDSINKHIVAQNIFFFEADGNVSHHIKHLLQPSANDTELAELLDKTKSSIRPEETVTIIYTSGTSGTPKGVMLSHENIMSNIKYYGIHYPAVESVVSYLPLTHIFERSAQYTRIYYGIPIYYVESLATIMRDFTNVKPEEISTIPRLMEKIYNDIMQKGNQLTGLKKRIFFWAFDLADQYDETGRNNSWLYLKKIAVANKLVFKEVKKAFGGRLKLIISGGAPIQPRLIRLFAAMNCPIIEGYGMTETSPVIATNSYSLRKIKAGTVGVPCANLDVRIDEETGEILVKGPSVMQSYYKDEEQTRLAFDNKGYFHTGDKGCFDDDGLLIITGRIKEIFKSSMGKFISPAVLENKFCESPWFNNIVVVGEYQKYAAALIVPNFEHIRLWCKENSIPYTTNAEMVKNGQVVQRIRQEVNDNNKCFSESEQIKNFVLLDQEWTIESGELTPSLKTRRSFIMEKYKKQIDSLFV
jgi:long-chain acyl-CoA synthetase